MSRIAAALLAALLLVLLPSAGGNLASRDATAAEPPTPLTLDAACRDAPAGRFDDVSGHHQEGIDCIGWWGVTQGVGGGDYDPSWHVRRGQMATFLATAFEVTGGSLPDAPRDAFADDDGSVHEPAIDQLAQIGVLEGVGDGFYATEDPVTRGQMATFLAAIWQVRTADRPSAEADFFDDDAGSTHEVNINLVTSLGLAAGTGGAAFDPEAHVSRAQMGTFLARLLSGLIDEGHAIYPPPAPVPVPAGCTSDGPGLEVSGVQSARWHERDLEAGTAIDAVGAVWPGVGDDPIRVGGGSGICWRGGHIDGQYGPEFTWDDAHETAAFSMYGPRMTVTDLRIHDEGDLVNLKAEATEFTLSRLHLSHGRDDCVENDYVHSGVLEDSLLDGCYTALSARPSSDRDEAGVDNEWLVRRSLIRLEPMEHVYKGESPGHGKFFKWGKEDNGVGLSLHDNVFMAEQPPNGSDLSLPEEYLRSCSGNVMVWLGDGEFPGWLPDSCFTVTTDRKVWDDAVASWKGEFGSG